MMKTKNRQIQILTVNYYFYYFHRVLVAYTVSFEYRMWVFQIKLICEIT